MSNYVLTHADAVAEIERRSLPRADRGASVIPAHVNRNLTKADLADAVELLAPAPAAPAQEAPAPDLAAQVAALEAEVARLRGQAPAPKRARAKRAPAPAKPERTPAEKAATEARKQAWAHKMAEKAAGRKVSYADACALFGTTPAKATA